MDPVSALLPNVFAADNPPPSTESRVRANRQKSLSGFTSSYIELCPTPRKCTEFQKVAETLDLIVVGSDQVWNPDFRMGTWIDFLQFAKDQQRVAYAASFGVESLPMEVENCFRIGLNGIQRLSVREESGARLVRQLTGREVPVVLDPTLLVSADQWERIVRDVQLPVSGEYILEYFLDNSDSPERTMIRLAAEAALLQIVDLNDRRRDDVWDICPLQFVDMIRHAHMVVTDSFHAVVFSILFKVPFYTRDRGNMNTRISNLLDVAGIEPRPLTAFTGIHVTNDIDWSAVANRLNTERRRSLACLQSDLAL